MAKSERATQTSRSGNLVPAVSPMPASPTFRSSASTLGRKAERTRRQILDVARKAFLEKGYAGTVIRDITHACGVSHSTFYTYFPTKGDLLLTIGHEAIAEGETLAKQLAALSDAEDIDEFAAWIAAYLGFLDRHGAFVFAWYQAAQEDPALMAWGQRVLMAGASTIGRALEELRGSEGSLGTDPDTEGLALLAMLERSWYYWRVVGIEMDAMQLARSMAHLLGVSHSRTRTDGPGDR